MYYINRLLEYMGLSPKKRVDPELAFRPPDELIMKILYRREPITFTKSGCIAPCNCTSCLE